MAVPRALAVDLSTYNIISSSGGYSGSYNFLNLQDYNPSTVWISNTVGGTQKLSIDFGTPVSASAIVVDNNNFALMTASFISVVCGDSADFLTGSLTVVNDVKASGSLFHSNFATQTKRYWGLWFSGGSVKPQVGNLFIGNDLVFSQDYDWNYKSENNEYVTNSKTALDGTTVSSQVYAGRIIYELKFSLQSQAFSSNYRSFVKTIRGRLNPFYFQDADNVTLRYMYLDSDYQPLITRRYQIYDLDTMKLKSYASNY